MGTCLSEQSVSYRDTFVRATGFHQGWQMKNKTKPPKVPFIFIGVEIILCYQTQILPLSVMNQHGICVSPYPFSG